jgi:hypothetical protein
MMTPRKTFTTVPCNSLTTAPVATCGFSEATEPTATRTNLPAPPDGTYVLTSATLYGTPGGDASLPAALNCEMVLTISGTSMQVFGSGIYGTSGQASYQINWVTGGPWVNITRTCGIFDPLFSGFGGNYDGLAAAQLSYDDTSGLVFGTPLIDSECVGASPIIFTFAAQ